MEAQELFTHFIQNSNDQYSSQLFWSVYVTKVNTQHNKLGWKPVFWLAVYCL